MGHQLEPFVSRFKSLKKGVWNKFLTPFNSHFMRMLIIAIIEFLGIAVAYFYNAGELIYHSVFNTGKGNSICILA